MRKEARRKDGTYIRFDDNAAVLINGRGRAGWHPPCSVGGAGIRERQYTKIVSLARRFGSS